MHVTASSISYGIFGFVFISVYKLISLTMLYVRVCLGFIVNILAICNLFSQVNDSASIHPGKGLEGIYIETYARHPQGVSQHVVGGDLPENYVTYRVFVDMAPGYKLQALYGVSEHPLQIETSTEFYNNQDFGGKCGDEITNTLLNSFNTAFDTWITLGAATQKHYGIPVEEDSDGSLLGYSAFERRDGMLAGKTPVLHFYGFEPYFFQWEDSSSFRLPDGAWTVYEGVGGITSSNRVLVLQLTTDGSITLMLNAQLISPDGELEQYVYKNPKDKEVIYEGLYINQLRTQNYETYTFTKKYLK